MQFQYFPNESRIVDLFYFPNFVRLSESIYNKTEKENYEEFLTEDWVKTFQEVEKKLKPFESEIESFYFEEASFPSFLMKGSSPFGFESVEAYLDAVAQMEESKLKKSFLIKLYLMAEDVDTATTEEIAPYLEDLNAQMALIESLHATDETKWKIMGFIRKPQNTVKKWIELMEKIMPIFNSFYEERKAEADAFGTDFVKRLNETQGDALETITGGMLTKKVLSGGNILVSATQTLAIELNVTCEVPFLKVGMDIETFLEGIKSAKANALKERVMVFKNLGDNTRYEVVRLLASGVESAKEIAQMLGVSQATISYHMSNLVTSKILVLEKNESKFAYRVNFEHLETVYQAMLEDFGYKCH